jgi:antitoxin component YwqK of YwqJK toxin-antitoxin module
MNINVKLDSSEENKFFDATQNKEVCETFHESGKLKERWTQKNGKLHGWYLSYYETGTLQHKIAHVDGKEDGVFESYFENAQL